MPLALDQSECFVSACTDQPHGPTEDAWGSGGVLTCVFVMQGALCVKRWRDGMLAKYKTLMTHAEMSDAIRQEAGLLDASNNL